MDPFDRGLSPNEGGIVDFGLCSAVSGKRYVRGGA